MRIRENLKVSIMCAIMPFVIGYLLYKHLHIKSAIIVIAVFLSVGFLSLVIPKLGKFIYKCAEEIGHFIGKYVAIAALFICYILAILPTGIIMKLVNRDRLRLKKPKLQSYWVDCENKNSDYEYQF